MKQCKSRRFKGFRIVRCTWRAEHTSYTNAHCDERARVFWPVRRKKRRW